MIWAFITCKDSYSSVLQHHVTWQEETNIPDGHTPSKTWLQYKFSCWQLWMANEWIHRTDTSITFPNAMLIWYQFKIFTKRPVEILTRTFHGVTHFLQQHALHNLKLCHNYCLPYPLQFIFIVQFHATYSNNCIKQITVQMSVLLLMLRTLPKPTLPCWNPWIWSRFLATSNG